MKVQALLERKFSHMPQMYLVSDEELNTLVRRRRHDVVGWVRQIMEYDGEELTLEERLALVDEHIRADNLGYDYQEQVPAEDDTADNDATEPAADGDEFAALEENDGENDTALDYALTLVDDDNTLSLLDVDAEDDAAGTNVEILETGPDETSTVDGVHVGEFPAFPSHSTAITQDTEPEPEVEQAAEVEPVALIAVPEASKEEVTKRNAGRERQLNREISQIDRDAR